jgi:hypothetical protein
MGQAVVWVRKSTMTEEWMMKRAYCPRCDCDMGMMIADHAPHPTCVDCIDREMGRWMTAIHYLSLVAVVAVVAGIVSIVIQLVRSQP